VHAVRFIGLIQRLINMSTHVHIRTVERNLNMSTLTERDWNLQNKKE
jgi:hypothetical protein